MFRRLKGASDHVVVLVACATALVVSCGSGSDGQPPPAATPTADAPTPRPSPGEPTPIVTPIVPPTPGEAPSLRLTEVASGLDMPLFVAFAPGDTQHFYVLEQTGRVRVVDGGGAVGDVPFLDLSSLVSCCGERGLLGLAFHPDYAQNGRLFVNYTETNGDTVIAEYARSAEDPPRARPDAVRVFFMVDQPFSNHNGGMLAFGPDGFLYIGLGDGGSAGDPQGNGQSLSTKLGKILRIDVDRYPTPPPGNLPGGDPQIWDFGLRNPWRFSFDRATGDLYIGDVGQNRFEEINVEPAGEGGKNYGWRIMEGLHCFSPFTGCDQEGLTLPVLEYGRDDGCSVTGGYVYRGSAIPGLNGRYLYGDYCSNRVWAFVWDGAQATSHVELTAALDPEERIQGLTSFGEDAAGELYVVSRAGSVFRIDPE
jgi:glucose/arabinose dehydrogenase